MEIYERNISTIGRTVERGLKRAAIKIPAYHTIEPALLPTTRNVGALDGSDQQLFSVAGNGDLGIGIWATLYLEFQVDQPDQECYRDGPSSAGSWSQEELLAYHLSVALPDRQTTRELQNDYYAVRQILSSTRSTEPPLFIPVTTDEGVRREAAVRRATGEWWAMRSALIHHLPPDALFLKDGRLNSQTEQAAHWVDQTGRLAARNKVRAVAVVKSGAIYAAAWPIVEAIAPKVDRPFYFLAPKDLIEESYFNEKYPVRKTLMVGGKDHTDLAGIGALWTVFCPDPRNFETFVVVEFNLYDLYHYKGLAFTPQSLRDWHINTVKGGVHRTPEGVEHVYVTDLVSHDDDIKQLVEPTLGEMLWLCEREVGCFGYPNLLGTAHHDVVLTERKAELLRKRYMQVFSHSDRILRGLVANDFLENPHKLHNIY